MWLTILTCLTLAQVPRIDGACNTITVNGVHYDKEIVVPPPGIPTFLDVDHQSNELYFNQWTRSSGNEHNILAKINLNTKAITNMNRVRDAQSFAINHEEKVIYYGTVDGIIKYDYYNEQVTYYKIENTLISKMYYKNVLYFKSYGKGVWNILNDTTYSVFKDLEDAVAWTFLIDDNTVYFSNYTGFYRQPLGTKDAVLIHSQSSLPNMYKIAVMVLDPTGQLYVSLDDAEFGGLYVLNKQSSVLEQVSLPYAKHISFDSEGRIIYASTLSGGVYRLIPNDREDNVVCIE